MTNEATTTPKTATKLATRWYEISQGSESKMYTLWLNIQNERFCNRRFVQNLSINKEEALAKAAYINRNLNFEILDCSMDELRDIARGPDVIRFGKYRDQRISDVPNGYINWLAQGAQVPATGDNGETLDYNVNLVDEAFQQLAKLEAVKRGLYVEYKDELMPINLVNYLIKKAKQDAISQHVGLVGEKISLKVTYESVKFFDTQFGMSAINILRTEDGSVIKYFGKDLRGSSHNYETVDCITGEVHLGNGIHNKPNLICVGITEGRFHTMDCPMSQYELSGKIKELLETEYRQFIIDNNITANLVSLEKNNTLSFLEDRDIEPTYDFEVGKQYTLSATVKTHDEFNGVKQTQVQRPKLSK